MHARVFEEFDAICRERKAGGDVLEIGTTAGQRSLLHLPALRDARSRIGVNTEPVSVPGLTVLELNANRLEPFSDQSFDTVLSNAVHEHDRYFWRSIAEIHRVTRSGGLIVIGVPGFAKLAVESRVARLARLPVLRSMLGEWAPVLEVSTACLQIHKYPDDYYRFSPQAVREVFLENLDDVDVRTVLLPPRVIGSGIKR